MLLLIMFLSGIERTSNKENCRPVAVFLHFFFFLITFMWIGVEAANLYQTFVRIFQTDKKPKKISISSFGYSLG